MSKKLLMTASDEYKGPIVYETISGTDIQAKPSNDNYSLLEDEPLYFEGCAGFTQFNGNFKPNFIGNEVEPGIYEYYILQKSVINPEKTSIKSFRINQQLIAWTDTWRDRLYWDDEEGCYMIEKNANFVRVDGTDPSAFKELSASFAKIPVDGYPNSMDDYKAPYVRSNWMVTARRTAIDNDWRSVIGYGWTANELVCFMNFDYTQTTEVLLGVFIDNPLNATFPAHNKVANGSLDTSGAKPVEGVRVERTNLTKKIKLKQYKGGTIYSMVSAEQALKSSVTISIPTMETKYLPKSESFSGVTVKPTIQDSNLIMEDDYVYFKGFSGTHGVTMISGSGTPDQFKGISLLGEYVTENTYRYTVNVKSADGTKSKNVTFDMPYQITGVGSDQTTNPVSKMYWSNEAGCYVADLYDKYLRIDSVPETYESWSYNGYTYFGFDTVNGAISYNTGANANCNVTTNWYNASLQYQQGTRAVGYKNRQTSYIGIAVKNMNDRASLNNYLLTSGYGPAEIIYRLTGIETVNTGIKKKIKLPWFGEGTIYTMVKTTDYGVTLSPTIEIEVPLKYDFKIAYKIFEGYAPAVQSNDCYVVRSDQTGYLMEVKGNSKLYWETVDGTYSNFTETIKLLGDKVPGGYLYKLRQTTSSGKINETAFVIQKMLAWYAAGYSGSSLPLQENLTANPMYWDILYWDNSAGRYKIEKRTEYYFADTAYGEVEFVPYSYSNYNLNEGDAWEFLALGYPNYDTSQTQTGRIYTNYANTSFAYNADVDLQYGVVFPVINNTSFGDSNGYNVYDGNGIGFRASNCKTLDALDAYLRSRPLHVITGAYYYNAARSIPFPVVDTNINKRIPIKISDKDAITGTTYTVSNDGLSAKIKIAIPVSYLDVEVPEPTYILNSGKPQEFTTGSQYVDTKLKLFETAKDFTVLLDYMHETSKGTFFVDNGVVFHCRYEASTSPYNYCGLSIQAGGAPTTYMYGGQGTTNYHPGIIADSTGTGRLTMYDGSSYRYRIMIVYKAGIPYKIAQVNESGDILFEYAINENHKKTFTAHSRPLYLGCQIAATSTSRSNYFKGTINECKIWDGTALTDGQIMKVIGAGPYPKPTYESGFYEKLGANPLYTNQKLFEDAKCNFSILLDFTHKDIGTATTTVLSCGIYGKNICRLCVEYNDQVGGYRIAGGSGNYTSDAVNFLANNAALPSVNDRYTIFIIYKNGVINRVVDCSTGVPIDLQLIDNPTSATAPYAITLGYMSYSENDTATNRDTCQVWLGQLNNCIIWKDKALNDSEIDYLCKYGCN